MKKLEKLVLQDVPKISESEQRCLLGGSGPDGWNFMLAPDGNWYCYPGEEAVVYGEAPGYITNLDYIRESQNNCNNVAEFLCNLAYICSGSGICTGNKYALIVGLSANFCSNQNERYAASYQEAIDAIERNGYTGEYPLRYYRMSNGELKIWDGETGSLIYDSSNN